MKNIFRETRSSGCSFFTSRNPNYPAHIHEEIELIYVKSGGGTAFCDGKKYELQTNDFFVAFPNQVHSYAEFLQGEYIVIIMLPSHLFRYRSVFLEGHPISAVTAGDNADIVYLFEAAYREFREEGYGGIVQAYLTAFFGKLIKCYTIEKSALPRDGVFKILEYCGQHYRENITVEGVARALGFSRSHISHIFSKRLNIGFCEYINTLRINDAVQLLAAGNYTVTEISDMSGFSTVRTFNRAFRAAYGVSPTEYRKAKNTVNNS